MKNFEGLNPFVAREAAILPAFKIPDLSAIKPEEQIYRRYAEVKTVLMARGVAYPCTLEFERFKEDESSESMKSNVQKAKLGIRVLNPDTGERVAMCNGIFQHAKKLDKKIIDDGKAHDYWHIYTRFVEKELRHKGLGSAMINAFEEVTRRIESEHSEMKAEWIEFNTYLASLTKMLISQEWLKEQGMEVFAKHSDRDFGYLPYKEDRDQVVSILKSKTEELSDVQKSAPEVCLYKLR